MPITKPETIRALQQTLSRFSPVELAAMEPLAARMQVRTLKPGDCFTRSGEPSAMLAVALTGLFRIYYLSVDGEMMIRRFATAGSLIGSYSTILLDEPAVVTTEALEEATIAEMSYQAMEEVFDLDPSWQRLGRKMIEHYYVLLERREQQFLAYKASERYALFLRDNPTLETRLSKADIASYIGITPVSLSRILSSKRPPK